MSAFQEVVRTTAIFGLWFIVIPVGIETIHIDPEPTVTAFDNLDAAANCKHFFVDAGHQRVSLDACSVYSSFEITSRAPRKGGRHVKS